MRLSRALVAAVPLAVLAGLAQAQTPGDKSRQDFLNDAVRHCEQQWTRRGQLDREMYQHCLEDQARSVDRIEAFDSDYPEPYYTELSYPLCYEKWTRRGVTDAVGMAYCLELETEGMADVQYYAEHHGAEEVAAIVQEAMMRYGSWHMAGVILRREYDPAP